MTNNNLPTHDLPHVEVSEQEYLLPHELRQIDGGIAGIRQEMLNNKYPENMPHEPRAVLLDDPTLSLANQ